MAIMKCEECGNDVSTKAKICQKCGAPAPTQQDYDLLQKEESEARAKRDAANIKFQKEKKTQRKVSLVALCLMFVLVLIFVQTPFRDTTTFAWIIKASSLFGTVAAMIVWIFPRSFLVIPVIWGVLSFFVIIIAPSPEELVNIKQEKEVRQEENLQRERGKSDFSDCQVQQQNMLNSGLYSPNPQLAVNTDDAIEYLAIDFAGNVKRLSCRKGSPNVSVSD